MRSLSSECFMALNSPKSLVEDRNKCELLKQFLLNFVQQIKVINMVQPRKYANILQTPLWPLDQCLHKLKFPLVIKRFTVHIGYCPLQHVSLWSGHWSLCSVWTRDLWWASLMPAHGVIHNTIDIAHGHLPWQQHTKCLIGKRLKMLRTIASHWNIDVLR